MPGNHLFRYENADTELFRIINISVMPLFRLLRLFRPKLLISWVRSYNKCHQALQKPRKAAKTAIRGIKKTLMVLLGPWRITGYSTPPGSIPLNRSDFRQYRQRLCRRRFPAAATRGDAGHFSGAMTRRFGSFLLQASVPQHSEYRRAGEVLPLALSALTGKAVPR